MHCIHTAGFGNCRLDCLWLPNKNVDGMMCCIIIVLWGEIIFMGGVNVCFYLCTCNLIRFLLLVFASVLGKSIAGGCQIEGL